jgi:hypothetical protein
LLALNPNNSLAREDNYESEDLIIFGAFLIDHGFSLVLSCLFSLSCLVCLVCLVLSVDTQSD